MGASQDPLDATAESERERRRWERDEMFPWNAFLRGDSEVDLEGCQHASTNDLETHPTFHPICLVFGNAAMKPQMLSPVEASSFGRLLFRNPRVFCKGGPQSKSLASQVPRHGHAERRAMAPWS